MLCYYRESQNLLEELNNCVLFKRFAKVVVKLIKTKQFFQ